METTPDLKASGTNLVDATYIALRDLIVDGQMVPGSRIIEMDVAPTLNVSRRTLQSALQHLQREGLVRRLEGKRAPWIVAPLTIQDLRELTHVMNAVLGWAGRCAAALESDARSRLVKELTAVNDEFRTVDGTNPSDEGRAADLDVRFHDLILEAIAGPRLREVYASQKPAVERYARTYATNLVASSSVSGDEHAAIIDAIECGDPDAAEKASRANWSNAFKRYCEVMTAVGERGMW